MPARANYDVYTVKKGDTLAAIAKRYGITVPEIAVASGVVDVNKIKVGQTLSIPLPLGYDPDNLDEVVVTAQRLPVGSSPKSRPVSTDPIVAAVGNVAALFQPPQLYFTLAAIAGLAYYLVADEKKRNRR